MKQSAYHLASALPPVTERRQPRIPIELPAVIELGEGASQTQALIVNLGLGGAFIQAEPPLSYGTQIHIHVQLAPGEELLRLPAVVRWNNAWGFGVQFLQLGARDTHSISAVVTSR